MTETLLSKPVETPHALPESRERAFDVYKGIAILAVLLHHLSGFALRQTVPGSTSRLLAAFFNRSLLFCVPAFLFLTVFLLSRSLLRRPMTPVEFWKKRYPRILIPYLLWSVFFAVYNAALGPVSRYDLINPGRWWYWLLYGKASFHLYFLVVVLQIYVFLPDLICSAKECNRPVSWKLVVGAACLKLFASACVLLKLHSPALSEALEIVSWAAILGVLYISVRETTAWCFKREIFKRYIGLWLWIGVVLGLQIGEYWTHKLLLRSTYPATLVISYYLPVLLGIWMALYLPQFQVSWPRNRWPLGLLALASLIAFFPWAWRMVENQPVNTFIYGLGFWAYTGTMILWLFGISTGIAARFLGLAKGLAFLGAYSMELYLIHPALLALVTRVPFHGSTAALAAYLTVVFVGMTGATLLLAMGLRKIGLGPLLFGR
jgi:surface polysaccharide O-acyltransferase-like enzyme